ncbi:phosphatidate cytidylyltransferase [Candidatus Pelagibacter sp.]|nr:phosphatidate cytidylyltransferase [Candidatus Pelagibacter sp.]|tara:strand:+ start:633 stop:1295 length:663 start_codon:yes stop_codon:yes gene_type:complete
MTKELKKRIFTSLLLFLLLLAMYFYSYIMITSLVIIAIIIWIEFYGLISKILIENKLKNKLFRFLLKAISLLYLSLLVYYILAINFYYKDLELYLLYSFFVAILSDIGGLVVGKTFKGKKLTKISPNKTISGSIGSFLFSLFLIPLFYNELFNNNIIGLILITILISLTSQLGDLFVSYIKRKANVKNTSNLLPGHGGFLDRVDGIIFAIPIGLILFNLH